MRQGCTRDEAVRRARLEFGGLDQIKEEHRDARGIGVVNDLGRDVRYAFRQFRRAPGFAVLAVLCLGLGIGVNTSIFGVINSVLLRPLPVAEPDRLVLVGRGAGPSLVVSRLPGCPGPHPRALRARRRASDGVRPRRRRREQFRRRRSRVRQLRRRARAQAVSGTLVRGRPGAGGGHQPRGLGAPLQSQSRRGRPAHSIRIRSRTRSSAWHRVNTPACSRRCERTSGCRSSRVPGWPRNSRKAALPSGLMLFGRLRDGATAAQASAELNAIDAQLMAEHGRPPEIQSPIVAEPVRGIPDSGMRRRVGLLTTLLAAVVGLVLLIACVNVGNLLLVRGALRQREFAVRRALGASRFRLLRQLLTESLVLGAGGGICGVILAVWTNRAPGDVGAAVPRSLRISAGSVARLARRRVRHDRLARDHDPLWPVARVANVTGPRSRGVQG